MDIKEALNILDQVTSVYKGTRQEHTILAQALRAIKEKTDEKIEPDKVE